MKRLMTTTALVLALGSTAFADGHSATFSESQFDTTVNLNASDILGARVYATEENVDPNVAITAEGTQGWDDIGEINEIVLTRDGAVQSVIVGVGGFLGLGEKDVAVDMTQLKIVSDGEAADEYFLVINANVVGIQDAPAYGMGEETSAMADDTAQTTAPTADTAPMLTAPTVERDGYSDVTVADLTAADLKGARVFGAGDEDVGEIGQLILTDDGQMDRAVIDIGGFLGLGEKPVAVSFDELQIMRSTDGNVRVYIDNTQEALEALPAYES